MISAKALSLKNKKTFELAKIGQKDRRTFLQLFGSEPEIFKEAAKILLEKEKPYGIDINAGCPVKKVVGTGAGSILMDDPEKLGRIVKAVRSVTDLPLSVKIRKGFLSPSYMECAKEIQDNGADLLVIHPRLRSEMFSGRSDFKVSAGLAEKLSIPVVHSGDITTISDLDFFKGSAVKGVMIGRGVLGAPWIFSELKGEFISEDKKKFYIKKHLSYYMSRDVDQRFGHLMIRKHSSWYSSGMKGASQFRKKIFEHGGDICDTVGYVNDFFGIDL